MLDPQEAKPGSLEGRSFSGVLGVALWAGEKPMLTAPRCALPLSLAGFLLRSP